MTTANPPPSESMNSNTESQSTARNELTDERVRNFRAWCATRVGSLSGADIGVALADAWLDSSRIDALRAGLIEAEALLCDERGGPAANELAARIRALLEQRT